MNWSNLKPHLSSLQNCRKNRRNNYKPYYSNIAGMSDSAEDKI